MVGCTQQHASDEKLFGTIVSPQVVRTMQREKKQ
jgi:hypothetical protein